MAPRRSGRRNVSAYKKGDYIEYQYKGSTVTGKLHKKSPNGTEGHPVWIVTPSDRRRKNEDIPEKALGKIIDEQEAMSNRGPKLKKPSGGARESSSPTSGTSNNYSDGSLEEEQAPKRKSGRGSPTEGNSKKKRKGDDSNAIGGGERARKNRKTVKFSREPPNLTTAAAALKRKISKESRRRRARSGSGRVSTRSRSARGSGEAAMVVPELPTRRKRPHKATTKRIKKDENVTVVKMLTGTLYLYRGDRPRAEFVRFK